MKLGERIREMRKAMGWKQVTLAQKTGISQATICRIEKGQFPPSLGNLCRIANALDITVGTLLDESPAEAKAKSALLCPRLVSGYCEREGCAIWLAGPGQCAERVAAEQLMKADGTRLLAQVQGALATPGEGSLVSTR